MAKKEKVENEKVCAILSYLLIGVIWYFADEKMKKSSFAKYHAKQGLVLIIASIIYSVVLQVIFSAIFIPMLFTGLWVGFGLFSLLYYIPMIWAIIGIINTVNDKEKPLPLIGKFGDKFSF